MSESEKVKIVNSVVYGVIAGVVASVISYILQSLASSINLGKYDNMDFSSQLFLGTPAGSPDLVGMFGVSIMSGVITGLLYGIIIFLLRSKAGWERNLTRYLVVAVVFTVASILLFIPLIPAGEFDFLVDGLIQSIIPLIAFSFNALAFYYLEEQFG
ncbi:MAG: hypothetical protein ACW99Q_27610 [Candidatus Kariarchaeaceae archaeon]|jgi:hypothetical protein